MCVKHNLIMNEPYVVEVTFQCFTWIVLYEYPPIFMLKTMYEESN